MLKVKQGGIKYYFWVFGMTPPGIEFWSPRPLANTLTIMPMARFKLFKLFVLDWNAWWIELFYN